MTKDGKSVANCKWINTQLKLKKKTLLLMKNQLEENQRNVQDENENTIFIILFVDSFIRINLKPLKDCFYLLKYLNHFPNR